VWKKRERDWPCKERPVFFGRVDELAGSTRLPRSKECSQEHQSKSDLSPEKQILVMGCHVVPVASVPLSQSLTSIWVSGST
jgi:hypothetical protein